MNACLSHRCIAEFVGTFALVFAGCGAIVVNSPGVSDGAITHAGVALVFGLIVMVMIYAVGDVSGAHFNPAVTLAFWASGRFPLRETPVYIAVQCGAALAAAGLLRLLFLDVADLGVTNPAGPWWQSAVLEVVMSFFLMFVILQVATGAKEKGMMAGVAIGGTVALDAMFGGPISGASMNPARSLGPAVFSADLTHLWFYIVAPIVGAVLAVPICLACSGDTGCCSTEKECAP